MSEDVHSSDNGQAVARVYCGFREVKEETASVDQRMNEIPVKKIKLPWTTRVREFASAIYKAIKQGISDVNKAEPPVSTGKKILDVILKLLTIGAGVFGAKKI
jgi:NADH:ubiquinone oxidoreductase subunit D